ncbi:hypothetical protein [Chelatococcus asaccharovorans]|uniref:Uncharacterized protein n=1 Tax=Chelatococcus asaccharovorans TaxID=28210 RepID=A0A2V3UAN9_9HYPH|nr:hypothetical protein [Chelatococcus asaccharovorans]MBS7703168.1 hypothetical protein [Chelatococcus asaccharovorans]PXW61497.1 hypothetical protein C7450_10312 [Chelatococcus asaccharovorans]
MQCTVNLTEAEAKALSAVALDPAAWIINAAKERARLAIDAIAAQEIDRRLASGEAIAGSKEDIVLAAFAGGYVIALADQDNIV